MQWMGINEIREEFLKFFESKNHLRLSSFPLIPHDDSSLLLINSGMAPMKNWFLGIKTPPSKRIVTCQKCIRTPDIERVGKTSRHGTFFEMLGNFSFGDYFKKEAIQWSWEFITKVLKLNEQKLYVTVYKDDDEAFNIWLNDVKVAKSHISRLGKEDNFWEIGSGPCGPCSEIYYDLGEERGCGRKDCGPGCDCDRFIEFWNLVFSQYDSDGKGNYTPMRHPNIDTGMGLERLGCIIQQADNLFLVDTVKVIVDKISELANIKYGQNPKCDVAVRVITDHIRSVTFMTADGVIPSNEGRGYVLRRLIRRAFRHGRVLNVKPPFLYKLVDAVVEQNKAAYPYLKERETYIQKIVKSEEESFDKILKRGMDILSGAIDKIDSKMGKLSGDDAFMLQDTYGFPFELIKDILEEKNLQVDETRFLNLMEIQKQKARNASIYDKAGWVGENINLSKKPKTEFIGYNSCECEATLLYIFKDGKEVEAAETDDDVFLVFNKTPFYAEGGGQVGDSGIFSSMDNVARILDCQKTPSLQYVHRARILSGKLNVNQKGMLAINIRRRESIARNHSAAHLLQKALQDVLGDHVHQAGQLVDEHRLRFDFNHFKAMTKCELKEVEAKVNEKILRGIPVKIFETDQRTARKKGAMALFGEKYGEIVRVVDMDDASIELCGGTHVDNTAKIGLFQILNESSASAGIRRIEATTGVGVLLFIQNLKKYLYDSCLQFKIDDFKSLPDRIKNLKTDLKKTKETVESLNAKITQNNLNGVLKDKFKECEGFEIIDASFNGVDKKTLQETGDKIKANNPLVIAALAAINSDKTSLLVTCGSEALNKGADANFIVKELAKIAGGNGGGKKSFAMAGIKDKSKLDEALSKLPSIIQKMKNI